MKTNSNADHLQSLLISKTIKDIKTHHGEIYIAFTDGTAVSCTSYEEVYISSISMETFKNET